MNKTKKLLSLLTATALSASMFAGLAITASAGDYEMDLTHTASTCCEKDKNTVTTHTVDAAKEHFNQEGSNGWQGYAFAEFSLSKIPEGETITSATLTWYGMSGGGYGSKLYYLNKEKTLNYDTIKGETPTLLRYNNEKTSIDASIASLKSDTPLERTADVTTAVQTLVNGEQNYIIFQWTANNGGADLIGKGAENSEDESIKGKQPTLVVKTTSEKTYSATVTAKNATTKANIHPTLTVKNSSDETVTAEWNGETNAFDLSSLLPGTYTYTASLAGYTAVEDGSFTVSDADVDESFEMTPNASVESITVKYSGDGKSLADDDVISFSADELYVGQKYTFNYPRYIVKDGVLYSKGATSSAFYEEVAISETEFTHTISYSKETETLKDHPSATPVFYTEAEDLNPSKKTTAANANIRGSKGAGLKVGTDGQEITTLSPGNYILLAAIGGSGSPTFTFKAGDTEIQTLKHEKANITVGAIQAFTITDNDTKITVEGAQAENNNYFVDYILIARTDNIYYADSVEILDAYTESDAVTDNAAVKTGEDAKLATPVIATFNVSDVSLTTPAVVWTAKYADDNNVGTVTRIHEVAYTDQTEIKNGENTLIGTVFTGVNLKNTALNAKLSAYLTEATAD